MGFIWFWLVAVMIVGYVVLDGFDLGVGVLHLFLVRNEAERQATLHSIGPVWDGNEVWLLAGGGTLYFAFPLLYASAFSGFYLPLMIVLWLLILRGVSLELRNHLDVGVWRALLDGVFGLASALLTIFFGAALANVLRGVPLQPDGYFFLPLWTNWQPGPHPGILDWYTVIGGLVALVALTLHGALWLTIKTSGELEQRARKRRHAALAALVCSHRRQPRRHHRRAPGQPEQLLQLPVHLCRARGRGCVAGRRLVLQSQGAARQGVPLLPASTSSSCWPGPAGVSIPRCCRPPPEPPTTSPSAAPSPARTHWPSAWSGGSSAWRWPSATWSLSTASSAARWICSRVGIEAWRRARQAGSCCRESPQNRIPALIVFRPPDSTSTHREDGATARVRPHGRRCGRR